MELPLPLLFIVGSRDKQTGSFLLTLAFGFLAGLLKPAMLASRSDVLLVLVPWLHWPIVLFIMPIGATLCFNLTRRYKVSPSP
jgi:hypothetical protein